MSDTGGNRCVSGGAGDGGALVGDHVDGLWGGGDDGLLGVDDASFFYDAGFPPLPEFPYVSSSSSSSSPARGPGPGKAAVTTSSSSSSSAASWVLLKSDPEEISGQTTAIHSAPPPPPQNLGYMDCDEMWDPSSVFQNENIQELIGEHQPETRVAPYDEGNEGLSFLDGNSELAAIFFNWLKQNKDCISAEDMRSIKLKRSTIESASRRLGSDKEGKKQLLKLILDWVEQHQLHKKRGEASQDLNFFQNPDSPYPDPNPNPYITPIHPAPPPLPLITPGFNGDPYVNYQQVTDYSPSVWQMPPQFGIFQENSSFISNQQGLLYGNNPFHQVIHGANAEGLARLGSSATKEARKKRMARQRKVHSHNHRCTEGSSHNPIQLNDPSLLHGDDELGDQSVNWAHWSTGNCSDPGATIGCPSLDPMFAGDHGGDQPYGERPFPQGWKTEKNLKFLLQKVLKQSDVGNLGRIVLPKREAESHLPELESRDGISIAMEDIGTSRVWKMRYRFWPNNKSRMYLLENTGDFVRMNGLQEGDFIVIYSDTKCGKYMIRGVKVRQPGLKTEATKPVRKNSRHHR